MRGCSIGSGSRSTGRPSISASTLGNRVAAMIETRDIIATLRTVLPGLRQQWPIGKLALFGSRGRDDARPDSDRDVLVEFSRPVALSSFLALEERLAGIIGLRVDLVTAASLKPYMGERVRAEAVAL